MVINLGWYELFFVRLRIKGINLKIVDLPKLSRDHFKRLF
jgi:hypothetical protein